MKVHAALRDGLRRGLKGQSLEAHVKQLAGVSRMTFAEIRVGSRAFRELVWPLTRPPAASQGRLPLL